jgi:hypothetical protein
MKTTEILHCHFCKRVVSEEDYCYGCSHYVCQECETNPEMPGAPHDVTEHVKLDD